MRRICAAIVFFYCSAWAWLSHLIVNKTSLSPFLTLRLALCRTYSPSLSVLAVICWALRPEAVLPDRALYLPTFSHFLVVNKTSLSLRRGERWAGWGSIPVFFSLDGRSPVSHPPCEVPFPPRRSGEYRTGMIPDRPLYQRGWGSI
jgi:hypothetical protein